MGCMATSGSLGANHHVKRDEYCMYTANCKLTRASARKAETQSTFTQVTKHCYDKYTYTGRVQDKFRNRGRRAVVEESENTSRVRGYSDAWLSFGSTPLCLSGCRLLTSTRIRWRQRFNLLHPGECIRTKSASCCQPTVKLYLWQ
jgi:hypothetical protein